MIVAQSMSLTAFECYKLSLALKQHFTSSYDYFKYNGKVSARASSFENRRDKFFFEKLSRKQDPLGFLLSNFILGKMYVGDLVGSEEAEKNYLAWKKRNQSLSYYFREDLKQLNENFDSNFAIADGSHPPLLTANVGGRVSLETLVILLHMTKTYSRWNSAMEYDPIWRALSTIVVKYQPFMKYDLAKMKSIVVDFFR